MRFQTLINLANSAYPESLISENNLRDPLAQFIYRELKNTFNSKATTEVKIQQAIIALDNVITDLTAVINKFKEVLETPHG